MEETSLQWKIIDDSNQEHIIIYHGMNQFGSIKVTIDGSDNDYIPSYVRDEGYYTKLLIAGREVILKISPDKKEAYLKVNSIANETGLNSLTTDAKEYLTLQSKIKNGRGSLLMMMILTLVNLALIMTNVNIYFPFSAYTPQLMLDIFLALNKIVPNIGVLIIGIILSVLLTLIYLPLYILSKKSSVSIWIALILFSIDTLILLITGLGDFIYSFIDIVFHAWVIWSLITTVISYDKIDKMKKT